MSNTWPNCSRIRRSTRLGLLAAVLTCSTACATWVKASDPAAVHGFLIARAVLQNYNSDHLAGFDAEAVEEINQYAGPSSSFLQVATASSSASRLSLGVVGSLGLMHADGGSATQFMGGVRMSQFKPSRPVNLFGEVTAGLTHFTGENDFTLRPAGGVYVPLSGKRFQLYGSFGLPIIFFSGIKETGVDVGGGIAIPFR